MRLRQIEIFHAVYVNGSISGAARALGISQPSVSKMLRRAEDQVGFPLFNLVRGRLIPTDEAHALFREVGDVFDRLTSLQRTASNLRQSGGGHIRLGVVPSIGLSVAPEAIAAFRRAQPNVTFDVQTLHHQDLVRALQARECDLAIAYDPPAHPRLSVEALAEGELAILFRKGAVAAGSGRLSLSILDGGDLIDLSASGPLGDLFAAATVRQGIGFRASVSVQTFYIAAALVQNGAGITVVDEYTARAWPSPDLDFRLVEPPLRFTVACVFLDERPLSRIAQRFVASLRESLKESRGRSQPID
jgi:DNA-binding transcriptional LysR family regulator